MIIPKNILYITSGLFEAEIDGLSASFGFNFLGRGKFEGNEE